MHVFSARSYELWRPKLAIGLADFGVEKSVNVEGMDAAGIGKQLEQLVAGKPQ
jgi:hypothetical protein